MLRVARSGLYYRPVEEREENLELLRLLDEQYTRRPYYGVRRMTAWLYQALGYRTPAEVHAAGVLWKTEARETEPSTELSCSGSLGG